MVIDKFPEKLPLVDVFAGDEMRKDRDSRKAMYDDLQRDLFKEVTQYETELAALRASRDEFLKLVREYRKSSKNHAFCRATNNRCDICRRADQLMKEPK